MSKHRPSRAQVAQRKHWEHLGQIRRSYGLLQYVQDSSKRSRTLTTFEVSQLSTALNALNSIRHSMLKRSLFTHIK